MESVPRVISLSPKNTLLFNPLEVRMYASCVSVLYRGKKWWFLIGGGLANASCTNASNWQFCLTLPSPQIKFHPRFFYYIFYVHTYILLCNMCGRDCLICTQSPLGTVRPWAHATYQANTSCLCYIYNMYNRK